MKQMMAKTFRVTLNHESDVTMKKAKNASALLLTTKIGKYECNCVRVR